MAIEILLEGACVTYAAPKIRAFLERELASPVLDSSGDAVEVRGKVQKLVMLTCAVVQGVASGAFLADRFQGEQKVSDLLVEIRDAAAPGDTITLRVHGGKEIDLAVAKPAAVYSALKRAADPPPAHAGRARTR